MSRRSFCQACHNKRHGVFTRLPVHHTCNDNGASVEEFDHNPKSPLLTELSEKQKTILENWVAKKITREEYQAQMLAVNNQISEERYRVRYQSE